MAADRAVENYCAVAVAAMACKCPREAYDALMLAMDAAKKLSNVSGEQTSIKDFLAEMKIPGEGQAGIVR